MRVAILDDGAKLADLNGLQMGKSFNMKNEDYFVGPCEHGTQMAICVREICPMAVLYIARLDNSNLRDNQAFTISSCHKVRGQLHTMKGILTDYNRHFNGLWRWRWMSSP